MNDFVNSRQKIQGLQYPGRRADIFAAMALFSIGIVFGLVAMAFLRTCDKQPEPVTVQQNCSACHKPPVITSYKQYRRFHQHPNAEDNRLAQEMDQEGYIVGQMLEAK